MKCESCGGTVEYQDGQGLFKCKYCASVYETEAVDGGQAVVRTIHIVQKKLESRSKTAWITSSETTSKPTRRNNRTVPNPLEA